MAETKSPSPATQADQNEAPTFPLTNIQVVPQGLIINIMLGPDLSLSKMLDEKTMNDVCRVWLDSRKQIKRDMDLAHRVRVDPKRNTKG